MSPRPVTEIGSLLARCDLHAPNGCWEFLGCLDQGYGRAVFRGKDGNVHKHVYEELVGPVEEGLELDHLCRNRPCCNPAHLEPVSRKVNILRGDSPTAMNARKVACLKGHPLSGDNLYLPPNGKRQCRACRKEASAKFYSQRIGGRLVAA